MDAPPRSGTGLACILRAEGASSTPYRLATLCTSGVAMTATTSAAAKIRSNAPISLEEFGVIMSDVWGVGVGGICAPRFTSYELVTMRFYLSLVTHWESRITDHS